MSFETPEGLPVTELGITFVTYNDDDNFTISPIDVKACSKPGIYV